LRIGFAQDEEFLDVNLEVLDCGALDRFSRLAEAAVNDDLALCGNTSSESTRGESV
jgi:hypothetical protein